MTTRNSYDRFRDHLPENLNVLSRIVQLDEEAFEKSCSGYVAGAIVESRACGCNFSHNICTHCWLHTCGILMHRCIQRSWAVRHEKHLHIKGEFGGTLEIKGLFGNFRTFTGGCTPEKMHEYRREFSVRFFSPDRLQILASANHHLFLLS